MVTLTDNTQISSDEDTCLEKSAIFGAIIAKQVLLSVREKAITRSLRIHCSQQIMQLMELMEKTPRDMMKPNLHYSIVIKWSDDDQAYVVLRPEWSDQYVMPVADGATYEEALGRGRNALENYIAFALADGKPLPPPRVFVAA